MTFRFEKLTVKSQEAVAAAQSLAQSLGHAELDSLHVLQALLEDGEGVVVPLLKKMGANVEQLKSLCKSELGRLPKVSGGRAPGHLTALDAARPARIVMDGSLCKNQRSGASHGKWGGESRATTLSANSRS